MKKVVRLIIEFDGGYYRPTLKEIVSQVENSFHVKRVVKASERILKKRKAKP
jgi:hypothetical protein